jgi:CHAT domain-containing protein
LFAKARRNQRSIYEQDLLAFAPIYEDISTARLDTNDYFNPALRAFQLNGSFSPLPESEREIKAINALQQNSSEYLIRREANKENLLQIIHKPYRFIHIAGHSFADLDNPKFSGIACWQGGEIKEDILFTSEIYNLKIQTDLVVLSSCESGLGSYDVSEGILGLNRAFLYAGANNVIFSLWKVYDKVSADLMINFYEKVMEEKPYSTALREAKLALINNPQTAAPHLWSSFLLIGR